VTRTLGGGVCALAVATRLFDDVYCLLVGQVLVLLVEVLDLVRLT
jgi:hypothetical protein